MKFAVVLKAPRRVRVDIDRSSYTNRWLDIVTLVKEDVKIIDNWVKLNKFGKRTAYNEWTLNSDQAVTAFVLSWHQREM